MKKYKFELNEKDWLTLRDGMADIACWHNGFAAAKPDYYGPPQLKDATDTVSIMKRQALDQS